MFERLWLMGRLCRLPAFIENSTLGKTNIAAATYSSGVACTICSEDSLSRLSFLWMYAAYTYSEPRTKDFRMVYRAKTNVSIDPRAKLKAKLAMCAPYSRRSTSSCVFVRM